MLILSKFKDYYDSSMGIHGIDKTIVYERVLQEFELSYKTFKSSSDFQTPNELKGVFEKSKYFWYVHNFDIIKKNDYDFYGIFVVGFCGKYYLGFKFSEVNDKYYTEVNETITYDIDEIKSHIHNSKKHGFRIKEHQRIDELFNEVKKINTLDTFRKYNTPIFIYYKNEGNRWNTPKEYTKSCFYVNPCLADYEFYKIFDAFTCFQEISMFMGGVLGSKEKEIIEVADKYKIQQHGFDKWSFRNPDPPKRKQKNKK